MAGYYYTDDNKSNKRKKKARGPVVLTTLIVSGAVLAILLIVLATNNSSSGSRNFANNQMLNSASEPETTTALDVANGYVDEHGNKDIERLYEENKLRAEDLDIWNMYPDRGRASKTDNTPKPSESEAPTDDPSASGSPDPSASPESTASPSPDGLIEGVKPNNLDYTNIKVIDDKMTYSVDGNKISKLGVDISEDSGVVDFGMLKNNGIDFVMIKVGSRGYDSGVINEDANFERNIKAASENGLGIGLYFCSRAVTVNEASDEAKYCMAMSENYLVDYPIAYVYEGEVFDTARTDILTKEDLTKLADAFLSTVKNNGHTPAIYGNGDFILNSVEADKLLKNYDVWLYDTNLMTEYPYQFKLWKYKNSVMIPGMEKPGAYTVSFVDYSGR